MQNVFNHLSQFFVESPFVVMLHLQLCKSFLYLFCTDQKYGPFFVEK